MEINNIYDLGKYGEILLKSEAISEKSEEFIKIANKSFVALAYIEQRFEAVSDKPDVEELKAFYRGCYDFFRTKNFPDVLKTKKELCYKSISLGEISLMTRKNFGKSAKEVTQYMPTKEKGKTNMKKIKMPKNREEFEKILVLAFMQGMTCAYGVDHENLAYDESVYEKRYEAYVQGKVASMSEIYNGEKTTLEQQIGRSHNNGQKIN